MNNEVLQVRQFAGAQQARIDAPPITNNRPTPVATPSNVASPAMNEHTEVAAHGPVPRLPGNNSAFKLAKPPTVGNGVGTKTF